MRSTDESIEYFQNSYTTAKESSYFDKTKKREICNLEMEFVNSLVTERGSVLDVGSGDGSFAQAAFEDGWTSYALDPAGPEREETVDGRSLRMMRGILADLERDARFNLITMWDVVEHLERPLDLILDSKNHLVPGGWLVIETGNFQSTGKVLGRKNWWCYQYDHRWYFNPTSLQELLARAGFSRFRLCRQTLRPWVGGDGKYKGPSRRNYLLRSFKRPWKTLRNVDEFKQLAALSREYPDTANLQIFALAAQLDGNIVRQGQR